MALRLPLQIIGTLGTSLWQLQVAIRSYTSRKGSGRRVIERIFSMDEKRAVVKEAPERGTCTDPQPTHDLARTNSSARQRTHDRASPADNERYSGSDCLVPDGRESSHA